MDVLANLVHRVALLQGQVEELCAEVERLRKDIQRIIAERKDNGSAAAVDYLAVAVASAQDLGPEFSSEDPHGLAGRGDDWFHGP